MERERLELKEIKETHENPSTEYSSYPVVRSRNEPKQREAVGNASERDCPRGAMRICVTADKLSDPRAI